jgi:allantoinase
MGFALQVTKESLNFKNKLSPYVGLTLRGRVEKTYLRGKLIYDHEQGFQSSGPSGALL